MKHKKLTIAAALVAAMATATACGGVNDDAASTDGEEIVLSMLADNNGPTIEITESIIEAFHASQDRIRLELETRPPGAEGDNLIKTRLATGEMSDLFFYNTGSLLTAIDPATNLLPLEDEELKGAFDPSFVTAASHNDQFYGAPMGTVMAGGMLYNKTVYSDLGLEIPTSWAEFMENNQVIKEAGIDPVIQTFGDTFTSQFIQLSDFHNVLQDDPEWADKYTNNEAKFVDQPGIRSFEKMHEVAEAGFLNRDFASAKLGQGFEYLVAGTGAHYPMHSSAIAGFLDLADNVAENIGFFGVPHDDASKTGATLWPPNAWYIPKSISEEKAEAAKEFMRFMSTQEACDAQTEAQPPTGPYMATNCEPVSGGLAVTEDVQAYIDSGKNSLALEYLSPIKGPNLEHILVEVGSGMTDPASAAARYDEDVKKQAQQLGLENW